MCEDEHKDRETVQAVSSKSEDLGGVNPRRSSKKSESLAGLYVSVVSIIRRGRKYMLEREEKAQALVKHLPDAVASPYLLASSLEFAKAGVNGAAVLYPMSPSMELD